MVDDCNFYTSTQYYDSNETLYFNGTTTRTFGSAATFFRGGLTLLLRAGFVLIQIGCIPITDVQMILLHNIIDIASGSTAYFIVGYILSFGHNADGINGRESWIISNDVDLNNGILGWAAVTTATAIFTTMMAGRMHCIGYVIVTSLFSMFIQPVFMYWVWSNSGWMFKSILSNHKVSYKDQGGGCVIHVTGGVMALFGGLFLGRRLLRLRDIDESSLPPDSPGNTIVGYILIIIGLMGFCLPTPTYERIHFPTDYIGLTTVNNIMAAAAGIISVVILQFILARDMFDYWVVIRCMQGSIAGIVTITAGVDVYNPLVAFGLGAAGALFFFITAKLLFSSSIEDNANIIPIHLVCGLFGTFFPPICGSNINLGTSHNVLLNFGWQIICSSTILAIMTAFSLIMFLILNYFGFMRNRAEERNNRRALTALTARPQRRFLQRIFTIDEEHQPYLQPGYRTKHENNFLNENRTSEFTISQMTPNPSSVATKNASLATMKSNAKINQSLTIISAKSNVPLSPSKLHVGEMRKPEEIAECSTSEEGRLETKHEMKQFQNGTKRDRQLFTVHSKGDEEANRKEFVINIEGEKNAVTNPNETFTSSDDSGEEIKILHYRKYVRTPSQVQDLPKLGSISCKSCIFDILGKQFKSPQTCMSSHSVGEGDLMTNKQTEIYFSNIPQRSSSAPHLIGLHPKLQEWKNSNENLGTLFAPKPK
ncbi:ammonium transporter 3-like [Periplaneta americana]|uniref:ammonium transporter 3-like n=1 Tax=Periplaneta americana TaxID=6978 RepID=UPI0037E9069B